jgi:hypothetical protein
VPDLPDSITKNAVLPAELPEPDYPHDFVVRRVYKDGDFFWNGQEFHLGSALRQEAIGVEPIDDGLHRLWFGHVYLGERREQRKGVNEFIANRT